MFSDRRGARSYHRVQWSSNRPEVAERLGSRPAVRSNRAGRGRLPVRDQSRSDYVEARRAGAGRRPTPAASTSGGASQRRRHRLRASRRSSHLRPGMQVLVARRRRPRSRRRSTTVEVDDYDGPVYDLEVDATHTYVADGVLVHNSHLPLPRRGHAQHPRVRGGVPRRHRRGARAELPLHPDHPRRRQRGHRQQPRAASRRSCGPTRAAARRSSATTPTTRPTRRSGSPTR